MKAKLEKKLDDVEKNLGNKIDAVDKRVDAIKNRIDAIENRIDAVKNRINAVQSQNAFTHQLVMQVAVKAMRGLEGHMEPMREFVKSAQRVMRCAEMGEDWDE